MKERGILFSAPMILALLEGRKTQTRRVIKPQPESFRGERGVEFTRYDWSVCLNPRQFARDFSPYGQPRDRLWVKETHRYLARLQSGEDPVLHVEYAADQARRRVQPPKGFAYDLHDTPPLRPSIFLHRWASRILLDVTDVRVEQLTTISEQDARAEGVADRAAYERLWGEINGPDSWAQDPFVWVVTFRRVP